MSSNMLPYHPIFPATPITSSYIPSSYYGSPSSHVISRFYIHPRNGIYLISPTSHVITNYIPIQTKIFHLTESIIDQNSFLHVRYIQSVAAYPLYSHQIPLIPRCTQLASPVFPSNPFRIPLYPTYIPGIPIRPRSSTVFMLLSIKTHLFSTSACIPFRPAQLGVTAPVL